MNFLNYHLKISVVSLSWRDAVTSVPVNDLSLEERACFFFFSFFIVTWRVIATSAWYDNSWLFCQRAIYKRAARYLDFLFLFTSFLSFFFFFFFPLIFFPLFLEFLLPLLLNLPCSATFNSSNSSSSIKVEPSFFFFSFLFPFLFYAKFSFHARDNYPFSRWHRAKLVVIGNSSQIQMGTTSEARDADNADSLLR